MDIHQPLANTQAAAHPREDIQKLWSAFAPLPLALRSRALKFGTVEPARAGDLFDPQNEVAIVLTGCLLIHVGATPICAGVAIAGDLVDLGGGASGRWLTTGSLYRTTLGRFLSVTGNIGLRFLLSAASDRTRALEGRLACAMAHPALSRVASLLLDVDSAVHGADVPLCQSDIGEMLSLRRTSVNGACQTLRLAGAVRTVRGRTIILDRTKLAAHACCGKRAGPKTLTAPYSDCASSNGAPVRVSA